MAVPRGPSLVFVACISLALALALASAALAAPVSSTTPNFPLARGLVINHLSDNATVVVNTDTDQDIAQGTATDGAGAAFSPPALLWIVFCFLVGVPTAAAGIRGWRLTSGVGVGLAVSVAAWASFINTVSSANLAETSATSDLVLTLIVLGAFVFGFVIGAVHWTAGLLLGIFLLALTAGLSLGIRIVLLRDGLLFGTANLYAANWALVGLCGLAGGATHLWRRRWSIIGASAAVGTFLAFLALDLVVNRQSGLSIGLRVLFDRNDAHVLALQSGYNPPISAIIIDIVSLVFIPLCAYGQNRFFPADFSRKTLSTVIETLPAPDMNGQGSIYSPAYTVRTANANAGRNFVAPTLRPKEMDAVREMRQMNAPAGPGPYAGPQPGELLPTSLRPGTPSRAPSRTGGAVPPSQSRGAPPPPNVQWRSAAGPPRPGMGAGVGAGSGAGPRILDPRSNVSRAPSAPVSAGAARGGGGAGRPQVKRAATTGQRTSAMMFASS